LDFVTFCLHFFSGSKKIIFFRHNVFHCV
jgi:hypothetical protein